MKNEFTKEFLAEWWESKSNQYPEIGVSGIQYFKGYIKGTITKYVDCLLYKDDKGLLAWILNHYPFDFELEKKGNFNVVVKPENTGKGIGMALLTEGIKMFNINLQNQKYTTSGLRLVNTYLKRKPWPLYLNLYKNSDQFTLLRMNKEKNNSATTAKYCWHKHTAIYKV